MADGFITKHVPLEEVFYADEYARIQLTAVADSLARAGKAGEVIFDEDDGYVLLVPVKGADDMNAAFSLRLDPDETAHLRAVYGSDIVTSPLMDSIELPAAPGFDDIAENFVMRFVWNCFIAEQQEVTEIVGINNDNADDFVEFLPDYFFGEDPYYAYGISVQDEEGYTPCGAAVFSFREDGPLIENVYIHEDFRGMGLGTYLADYVLKSFAETEKE